MGLRCNQDWQRRISDRDCWIGPEHRGNSSPRSRCCPTCYPSRCCDAPRGKLERGSFPFSPSWSHRCTGWNRVYTCADFALAARLSADVCPSHRVYQRPGYRTPRDTRSESSLPVDCCGRVRLDRTRRLTSGFHSEPTSPIKESSTGHAMSVISPLPRTHQRKESIV